MDFERRHVLGNLLRDQYKELFEGHDFRRKMCEHARPILRINEATFACRPD
ncbi:hypothetical protein [Bradyrhizobium sp. 35]|uniref:hypothetical protein n=1 Tax=Bradyrhizobium sp. 35 TaxID=2782670 RepID=UPI001FF7FB4C|nr:hypothetical protein [Bradyrhizobium sp. 35]